jgi:hypothetical protein
MPNPIVHFEVLGKDKAVLEDFAVPYSTGS